MIRPLTIFHLHLKIWGHNWYTWPNRTRLNPIQLWVTTPDSNYTENYHKAFGKQPALSTTKISNLYMGHFPEDYLISLVTLWFY